MNLEFYIRLKEMVSGGLAKIASTAKNTTAAIKGTNDSLNQSYDRIRSKTNLVDSAISKSTSQVRALRQEVNQLNSAARAPSVSSGGWFKSLMPAIGIAGVMALGGQALSNGLDAQARQASFEVIAGKQQGTQLNKNLTKYAQDSIYGNEVYQNAQTMLGFGINSKDVMNNIKMLGDVAMGDANKLGSLSLAFSQVSAAGKLTGQDLLQFINAGFNPLQQISKDTGVSLGDLKKQVEKGAISFKMVEQAFKNATGEGGMFYQMTQKIADTDFGKWQAFQGQLEGLSTQIGGILAPALGALIGLLSPLVTLVSENIGVFMALGAGIAAYALYVNAATIATNVWAAATWLLDAAMAANPIGLVIAAIAALIAGVIYAWNKFDGFRGALIGVWEVAKKVGSMFVGLGKILIGAFTFNPAMIADGMMQLKNSASTVGEAFSKGYNSAKTSTSASTSDIKSSSAKGASVSDVYSSMKSGGGGSADDSVRGVASGGQRMINITIGKLADVNISAANVSDAMAVTEDKVNEIFLRVLNSGAAMQVK